MAWKTRNMVFQGPSTAVPIMYDINIYIIFYMHRVSHATDKATEIGGGR